MILNEIMHMRHLLVLIMVAIIILLINIIGSVLIQFIQEGHLDQVFLFPKTSLLLN